MMTREELYGGSHEHIMETHDEVWVIPYGTDARLLYIAGDDIAPGGPVTVVLPDRASIRQHGWLVYAIVNDSGVVLDLEDADNTFLGFINHGEVFYVGLVSAVVPIGPASGWALRKTTYDTGAGNYLAQIINLGGSTGAGTEAEAYQYSTDTWVSAVNPLPSISGTGAEISSAGVPTSSYEFRIYYGQSASFFEYTLNTAFARQYGNYVHRDTGLGVILGSAIGDLMHVSNAQTGQIRKMEGYGVVSDAWIIGADFPTFTGFTDPEINTCESLGESDGATTDWEIAYISPSTLDTSAMLIGYNQQAQTYYVAAYPPWPRGPYLPSLVGIADRLHFQGGSYSSASAAAYSVDAHTEYNPFLNSWATLPALPVIGRGLGICPLNDPRDRYFFGMGETTSVPSEVHFEYNLTTRTYRARGTFAWGSDRESQNSAWSRSLV